jgi:O-antigen/teichoic acid export membrane protein
MNLRGLGQLSRLFSSAVINQAVLSLTSLLAGLVLVRRTPDLQYGYYVLGWNAILLLTSLQNSYFAPPLAVRLTRLDRAGRSDVVGSLYRAQKLILTGLAGAAVAATAMLWLIGLVDHHLALLILAIVAACCAALTREYFRMVLLAYHRPQDVLKCDAVYVVALLAGVNLAPLTPEPAACALATLAVSAALGAQLLSRRLRRHEPWTRASAAGVLREIGRNGLWSSAGAAIHWTFSQGYNYLVAALLGVSAIAAIAATRLLMMPLNLLSTGLGSLMLPLAARWLHQRGPAYVLRRLMSFAIMLAGAGVVYFAVLWLCRDWIFDVILKKHFEHRDALIVLWSGAFMALAMRDQLIYLLVVQARFRLLTSLTTLSAILSLAAIYLGARRLGQVGVPLGVMLGELVSVVGITYFSLREVSRGNKAPPVAEAAVVPTS